MSRIYFHSEHGTAELRGSERAYMGHVCQELLESALDLHSPFPDERAEHWVAHLLPEAHYARRSRGHRQLESLRTAIYTSGEDLRLPDGTVLSAFDLALNTALRIGGDPLRLMARLHGQCELHCWVDGPNRAWLAGIIEQGRAINLYRPGEGWENVAALLRSRDDGPVVCSYSVCEGFPNRLYAKYGGWTAHTWPEPELPDDRHSVMSDDEDEDADEDNAWERTSREVCWRCALAGLRATDAGRVYTRELRPDAWADYVLGQGLSGYDLAALAPELTRSPR